MPFASTNDKRLYNKTYYEALRGEALSAYGKRCVICGESSYEFLAIDHVGGGGNKERKACGSVYALLLLLRRRGWPSGYQVLCHNCNYMKSSISQMMGYEDPGHYPSASCDRKRNARGRSPCRLCDQARNRKLRVALRAEVMAHYGSQCNCCGSENKETLSVDHVGGGGNGHRRLTGCGSGWHFYRWLKANGWPDGFRLLCMNCNLSDGFYGACPHRRSA